MTHRESLTQYLKKIGFEINMGDEDDLKKDWSEFSIQIILEDHSFDVYFDRKSDNTLHLAFSEISYEKWEEKLERINKDVEG